MNMVEVTLTLLKDIVTIVGVIAGFTYYVITVRNANKAMKIQLINRNSQFGQNMEFQLVALELLEMKWEDFDDFLRKYDSTVNQDNYAKRNLIFSSMVELGFLLKENVLDIDLVYKMADGGYSIIQMWNKFKSIVMKHREIYEDPNRYQWFEYLVNELIKERVKHGLSSEIVNTDGYWTE